MSFDCKVTMDNGTFSSSLIPCRYSVLSLSFRHSNLGNYQRSLTALLSTTTMPIPLDRSGGEKI